MLTIFAVECLPDGNERPGVRDRRLHCASRTGKGLQRFYIFEKTFVSAVATLKGMELQTVVTSASSELAVARLVSMLKLPHQPSGSSPFPF